MVHKHWFHHTATRFYYVHNPKRWYAAAIPWSVTRKQAFAGTHDQSVLMIFDEASEVEDVIWETAFGALTTDGSMMIAVGNPTQNTGISFVWIHATPRRLTRRRYRNGLTTTVRTVIS